MPIALGILAASGQIEAEALAGYEFAGELSLSGQLRPVRGALATSLALHTSKIHTKLVLPPGSAEEAALVPDTHVYRAHHLLDVVRQFLPVGSLFQEDSAPDTEGWARMTTQPPQEPVIGADLADVKGQAGARVHPAQMLQTGRRFGLRQPCSLGQRRHCRAQRRVWCQHLEVAMPVSARWWHQASNALHL